jgi:hypothetical protein
MTILRRNEVKTTEEKYIRKLKQLKDDGQSFEELNIFNLLVKLGEIPDEHNIICMYSARVKMNNEGNE